MSTRKFKNLPKSKSGLFTKKSKPHKEKIDRKSVVNILATIKPNNYRIGDLTGKSHDEKKNEFKKRYGIKKSNRDILNKALKKYSIKLRTLIPELGLVQLKGNLKNFESFFSTKIQNYTVRESLAHSNHMHVLKGHVGKLAMPEEVADLFEGVVGLNDNLHSPSISKPIKMAQPAAMGYPANWFARHYNYPTKFNGEGQKVVVIAGGGGYNLEEYNQHFAKIGVNPVPKINSVSVLGVKNSPGVNLSYDYELATDVQVIGGIANGAEITVYFTKPRLEGFMMAVLKVIANNKENPPIISYSWGSSESEYSEAELSVCERILSYAALVKDMTILCTSGDYGSTNNRDTTETELNVEYPGSSPYVTTCGGSMLILDENYTPKKEVVWNSHYIYSSQTINITGGGFSSNFSLPAYQKDVISDKYPSPYNKYRGLPDVAGLANVSRNNVAYWVHFDGMDMMTGGTSAVAPLWAALIALINQGVGKPCGYLNPTLYEAKGTKCFKQILEGNNSSIDDDNFWNAGPVWNPCCGLGVPNGKALLQFFKKQKRKSIFIRPTM